MIDYKIRIGKNNKRDKIELQIFVNLTHVLRHLF